MTLFSPGELAHLHPDSPIDVAMKRLNVRREESRRRRMAETSRRAEQVEAAHKRHARDLERVRVLGSDPERKMALQAANARLQKAIEDAYGGEAYRRRLDESADRGYRSAFGLPMPPPGHKPAFLPSPPSGTVHADFRKAAGVEEIAAAATATEAARSRAVDAAVGRILTGLQQRVISSVRRLSSDAKALPVGWESKSFAGVQLKSVDTAEPGTCDAIVSVTGNEDHGGDTIEPGAFEAYIRRAKSGAAKWPRLMWDHGLDKGLSALTGKVTAMEELLPGDYRLPDDLRAMGLGGLVIRARYNLDTTAGREAWAHVKAGDVSDWSFAYDLDEVERLPGGKRRLKSIKNVYECSNVLVGMNPEARTLGDFRRPGE